MSILPIIILSASILLNAVLTFFILRKRKAPQPKLTKDATELLAELTSGGAVVVTNVLDPAYLFEYSPKDK